MRHLLVEQQSGEGRNTLLRANALEQTAGKLSALICRVGIVHDLEEFLFDTPEVFAAGRDQGGFQHIDQLRIIPIPVFAQAAPERRIHLTRLKGENRPLSRLGGSLRHIDLLFFCYRPSGDGHHYHKYELSHCLLSLCLIG